MRKKGRRMATEIDSGQERHCAQAGAHLFRYSQTPKHTVPQHITLYENNYACVTTLHRNIKTGHIFEIIYYFVTKVII